MRFASGSRRWQRPLYILKESLVGLALTARQTTAARGTMAVPADPCGRWLDWQNRRFKLGQKIGIQRDGAKREGLAEAGPRIGERDTAISAMIKTGRHLLIRQLALVHNEM
jgi:hypothetical protein